MKKVYFLTFLTFFLIHTNVYSYEYERSFISWGTNFDIRINSDIPENDLDDITQNILEILEDLNKKFNSYDKSSEISKLNLTKKKEEKISKELFDIINISKNYHNKTMGYFDITIGAITEQFSFEKNNEKTELSKNNKFIKNCTGWDKIELKFENSSVIKKSDCLKFDLGGLAEGYAIKKIIEFLEVYRIEDAIINFGGNISTLSKKNKWLIKILEPKVEYKIYDEIELNNLSISVSSKYSKTIVDNGISYSHIFNPVKKKLLIKKNISVSVISDDPVYCDVMSTTLITMSKEKMLKTIKLNDIKAIVLESAENGASVIYDFRKLDH